MDGLMLPHNERAERELLGTVLVTDVLDMLINDIRMTPEHFYLPRHGAIFAAATRLADRGEAVDAISVEAELRQVDPPPYGWGSYLMELASTVMAPSSVATHARLIQEAAKWRHYTVVGQTITAAAQAQDEQGLAQAEALLGEDIIRKGDLRTPEQLGQIVYEHLTAEKPDVFPWPFKVFNDKTGGMYRGEVTIVSGWTSHGKSVLADQMLETVAKRGYSVCLYINEMNELQRTTRWLAKVTGIPYTKIMSGRLDERELSAVTHESARIPYPIVNVAGWSADEITHHIRRHRWDFCVMDIIHEIPFEDEKDIRTIGSAFNRTAKQANCHIVYTAHLSEHRAHKGKLPLPVESDVRGSGMLKNQVDFLVFVWLDRDNDEAGIISPTDEGMIYLAKGRSTGRVGFNARLHPSAFRWEALAQSAPPSQPVMGPPPPATAVPAQAALDQSDVI